MGILTIVSGLVLIMIGLGSLITRRSLLPELEPGEAALAGLPFGLITLFLGIVIQAS
jgi:hypothetical protein